MYTVRRLAVCARKVRVARFEKASSTTPEASQPVRDNRLFVRRRRSTDLAGSTESAEDVVSEALEAGILPAEAFARTAFVARAVLIDMMTSSPELDAVVVHVSGLLDGVSPPIDSVRRANAVMARDLAVLGLERVLRQVVEEAVSGVAAARPTRPVKRSAADVERRRLIRRASRLKAKARREARATASASASASPPE